MNLNVRREKDNLEQELRSLKEQYSLEPNDSLARQIRSLEWRLRYAQRLRIPQSSIDPRPLARLAVFVAVTLALLYMLV